MIATALLAVSTLDTGFAAAADPVIVRLGFADVGPANQRYSRNGIGALAHARRYIAEEFKNDPNIKFEFSFHRGGPVVNEAIANEQLDIAQIGDLPGLLGRANGLILGDSQNPPRDAAAPIISRLLTPSASHA